MTPDEPLNESCTLFSGGPTTCAICGVNLEPEAAKESPLFPFCSRRCKQVDLLRWTEGRYAITEPLTLERLLEEQLKQEREGDQPEV